MAFSDPESQSLHTLPHMQIRELFEHHLSYVREHPEDIPKIGIAPAEGDSFIINTRDFASYTGLKITSINKTLKRMHFGTHDSHNLTNELHALMPKMYVRPNAWTKRVKPGSIPDPEPSSVPDPQGLDDCQSIWDGCGDPWKPRDDPW
jgi:hypothetical protein